jgi:hypothetical protein
MPLECNVAIHLRRKLTGSTMELGPTFGPSRLRHTFMQYFCENLMPFDPVRNR